MKLRTLLAASTAIGLTSLIAVAGYNSRQLDTGAFCLQETAGVTSTDRWCLGVGGVQDVTAGVSADSAATNDMFDITMDTPVDTTGTNTHNALTIDIGIGNATGGTNTARGIQIDAIAGDAQVTTTGINIGNMTGTGGTENAIVIGTGWDLAALIQSGVTLDDATTDSPVMTFQDATDETVTVSKVDAGALDITSSATGTNDGLRVMAGSFFVGNGTPGETINGEDMYVEGLSEFDGTANFDGTADFDGAITIDSTTITEETLKFMARSHFIVCGDLDTVNNNTLYFAPTQGIVSSATVGQRTCNTTTAGNATEATVDEPAIETTAIYPLGMTCWTDDLGATVTFTLRTAGAAYMSGGIVVSVADNIRSGAVNVIGSTAIASGATVAIAAASTADMGASTEFICEVSFAY